MNIVIENWPTIWQLGLPVLFFIIVLAIAFIAFGIKTRSPFFFLATLLCILSLIFSEDFAAYAWLQMGLGMVALWAILATITTIMKQGGEG